MESLDEIIDKTVIKSASSTFEINELLKSAKRLSKDSRIIQLFNSESVINKTHLYAAYANALESFKDHSARSNSIATEMLLFAGMTGQIGEAIEKMGAKDPSDFILFCSDAELLDDIRECFYTINDFRPDKKHVMEVAERFGIHEKDLKLLKYAIMQKIALSKLE